MAKVLRVTFPDKCIGCELCVLETQRQLKKFGLDGASIRIFRKKQGEDVLQPLKFEIQLDQKVNKLDIQKIKAICPTQVFSIEDVKDIKEEHGL